MDKLLASLGTVTRRSRVKRYLFESSIVFTVTCTGPFESSRYVLVIFPLDDLIRYQRTAPCKPPEAKLVIFAAVASDFAKNAHARFPRPAKKFIVRGGTRVDGKSFRFGKRTI